MPRPLPIVFLTAIIVLLVFIQAGPNWASLTPEEKICPTGTVVIPGQNSCIDKFEYPNRQGSPPVVNVSREDAEALCKISGKRLPTEKEWELACRGRELLIYPYGNTYKSKACRVARNQAEGPAPAGTMPLCRSAAGAFDMSGNVWEWTSDTIKGQATIRGGSWLSGRIEASCVYRDWAKPQNKGIDTGFRCVSDIK